METNFSVLMAVYYKDDPIFLDQALKSVVQQTAPPAEIVLVKDGLLSDGLEQIISTYLSSHPHLFKIIPLPQNRGLANALNEGLKNCRYDLVARMDSDDICNERRFEKQLAFWNRNKTYDVIGTNIEEFSYSLDDLKLYRKVPQQHREIVRTSRLRCPVNHMSVMYKKEKVLSVGGYVQSFGFFEDYSLWVKMIKNGCRFYNIQETLNYVRVSDLDMIKRRRGWNYAKKEWKLAGFFFKIEYINLLELLFWIGIRIPLRLMPVKFLHFIYRNTLRKDHSSLARNK